MDVVAQDATMCSCRRPSSTSPTARRGFTNHHQEYNGDGDSDGDTDADDDGGEDSDKVDEELHRTRSRPDDALKLATRSARRASPASTPVFGRPPAAAGVAGRGRA